MGMFKKPYERIKFICFYATGSITIFFFGFYGKTFHPQNYKIKRHSAMKINSFHVWSTRVIYNTHWDEGVQIIPHPSFFSSLKWTKWICLWCFIMSMNFKELLNSHQGLGHHFLCVPIQLKQVSLIQGRVSETGCLDTDTSGHHGHGSQKTCPTGLSLKMSSPTLLSLWGRIITRRETYCT